MWLLKRHLFIASLVRLRTIGRSAGCCADVRVFFKILRLVEQEFGLANTWAALRGRSFNAA